MAETAHGKLRRAPLLLLVLGSLGVVFGDIGTSPLYAVTQIFFGQGQVPLSSQNILGAIGLIIWALTAVVTLKYIIFVLLAHHEGQGGVFALLGLLSRLQKRKGIIILTLLLILAAGLLFGEGLITPAISILSAVEGLSLATSVFQPYIIPITLVILTILFSFQYKGTKSVGAVFGPVMVIWFLTIGLLGLHEIIVYPAILNAFNPVYVIQFLFSLHIRQLLLFFGALVLAITGVESLYADMGHFGSRPIRIGWLGFVYPALMLNYLGQGAHLLSGAPIVQHNIFYSLVPHQFIIPMVILAAVATAIASQALISGAYSLVAQAVALNYLPRVKIIHTNKTQEGQIYVPAVNWLLYLGAAALVIHFQSSTALAGAYGFAVSGVMLSTSLAMISITALWWKWGWFKSTILFGGFAIIDLLFLVSKSLLFFKGGYVPTIVGICLFIIMTTWYWGRKLITNAYTTYERERTVATLINLKKRLHAGGGVIVDERGQFVEAGRSLLFLVHTPVLRESDAVPILVRAHMRHGGSIPQFMILLHISREPKPYIASHRYQIADFGYGMFGVDVHFGFMEEINLERIVDYLQNRAGLPGLQNGKYMIEVGKEELRNEMNVTPLFSRWRVRLYRQLQRLAAPSYRYFGLAARSSLSTVSVPIVVASKEGKIHMPELDLA